MSEWDNFANVTYQFMYGLADLNQMNNAIDTYLKETIKMWLDLGYVWFSRFKPNEQHD